MNEEIWTAHKITLCASGVHDLGRQPKLRKNFAFWSYGSSDSEAHSRPTGSANCMGQRKDPRRCHNLYHHHRRYQRRRLLLLPHLPHRPWQRPGWARVKRSEPSATFLARHTWSAIWASLPPVLKAMNRLSAETVPLPLDNPAIFNDKGDRFWQQSQEWRDRSAAGKPPSPKCAPPASMTYWSIAAI